MKISFRVQGSAPEPYEVVFVKRSNGNLSAYCSCPAGENGIYCKHRFNILDGSTKAIVSENLADVEIVRAWLPGTELEVTIAKMRKLEVESEKVKRALAAAKKNVALAMRD